MSRRILPVLVAALMVISAIGIDVQASSDNLSDTNLSAVTTVKLGGTQEETYAKIASSSSLDLYVHEESGRFFVQSASSQSIWYSNPPKRDEDQKAAGVYRMELCSLLVVNGINVVDKQLFKKNSEVSSVRKDAYKYERLENGFCATYTFPEEGFVIPVEVQLENDLLKIAVKASEIKETKPDEYLISSIDVLPYFGAAGKQSQGYVFVPDGSGALMYLNNNRQTFSVYEQQIYGKDDSIDSSTKPSNKQDINLPVFGIKDGEQAFLSVVTSGEEAGVIRAVPNLKVTEYAQAYSNFVVRQTTQYTLGEDTSFPQTTLVYRKGKLSLPKRFEMTVFFLTGDNATYSGMALRYREFLWSGSRSASKPNNNSSLFIDVYGAVKGTTPFLGIPIKTTKTLTKFTQAKELVESIGSSVETSIQMRYLSWNKDSLAGKVDTHISPASVVGSLNEMRDLQSSLSSANGNLFLDFGVQMFQKSGNGVSTLFDNCKSLTKVPAGQYEYYFSTRLKNRKQAVSYLLTENKLNGTIQKLLARADKLTITNLSFSDLGDILYSDYGKVYSSRSKLKETVAKNLSTLSENRQLLLSNPKAFAMVYADFIVDAPMGSSDFDVLDESVPFLQMVLSGSVAYAGTPLNLSENPRQAFLKCLETGTCLRFALIAENEDALRNTQLDWLYCADAKAWSKDISQYQSEMNRLFSMTDGTRILRHAKVGSNVYLTEYENGTQVYVNYGEQKEVIGEVTVDGKGYQFVKGEQ